MSLDLRGLSVNPTVAAAIIAALVSLLVGLLTFISARWQVRAKVDELLQSQFKDIIAKRIEAYPKLWRIPQEQLSDWERLRKPINKEWARTLLDDLMVWHIEYGVFLSQQAYEAFSALRAEAISLVRQCEQGYEPTLDDLQRLDGIYYKGYPQGTGSRHLSLATCLKKDLGSYASAALSGKN